MTAQDRGDSTWVPQQLSRLGERRNVSLVRGRGDGTRSHHRVKSGSRLPQRHSVGEAETADGGLAEACPIGHHFLRCARLSLAPPWSRRRHADGQRCAAADGSSRRATRGDNMEVEPGYLIGTVGAIAAFFAGGQWHTARTKLAFDLFERRLAAVDDLLAAIGMVLASGEAKTEDILKFSQYREPCIVSLRPGSDRLSRQHSQRAIENRQMAARSHD